MPNKEKNEQLGGLIGTLFKGLKEAMYPLLKINPVTELLGAND